MNSTIARETGVGAERFPVRAEPPGLSPRTRLPNEGGGRIVRWSLYVLFCSLPFDFPNSRLPFEVTTIAGCVFLAATLLQPRTCYGRLPAAFWWFTGYLYAFGVAFALGGGEYPADALRQFLMLLQLVLIFAAAYNLLRRDEIAKMCLLSLALAGTVLAVLQLSGVVTQEADVFSSGMGHVSAFGQNANRTGKILAAGVLALVGLALARDRNAFRPRVLAGAAVAAMAMAIIQGASRGSLLALAVGFCPFVLSGRRIGVKIRNGTVAILAISAGAWATFQSPVMRARFEKAQAGDLAGREEIFPTAWRMFQEKPLTGWGPTANKYEIASRLPEHGVERRDTHNLVLEVLTATGVLGAIPFFFGVLLCVRAAWASRHGAYGILPFALVACLLAGNMAGNYIVFKLHWLVLAYAAASASSIARAPSPRKARRPLSRVALVGESVAHSPHTDAFSPDSRRPTARQVTGK